MFNNEHYVIGERNLCVPAHLNFGKYILNRIKLKKDEVALVNGLTGEKLTYENLTQYAVNLAVSLSKLGVAVGDTVAVGSEKRIEFLATILGIVFAGATCTAYDLKSGRAVLMHKISITKPKYFICSNMFWHTHKDLLTAFDCVKVFITLDDSIESLIPLKSLMTNNNINVDLFEPVKVRGQTDVAFIFYSSGTTGMPKGVELSHLNCIINSLPHAIADDSLESMFVYGEWYHTYDTFMAFKFFALGKKVVYVNDVSPQTFLKACQDEKVDIAMIVPSIVEQLSKINDLDKFNLDSLKIISSLSCPLHAITIERVKKRLPKLKNILQAFGMTECSTQISERWGVKGPKPGSVGMAAPGTTIKVVDIETRKILGPNQQGEICFRGPTIMKGYIGIDPSTYLDEDGFFKSGDFGYYDDDKYFYIVDRIKEIICYDGYKIAPIELEVILQHHSGVKEVAAVGKPVPEFGEEPTAFVVRQPGSNVTEEELVSFVAEEVAPFMQLRGGIRFLEELPRNARGKVLRRKLREMLQEN